MSFCQKHQNHHCVHAHSCKNPEHKQPKRKNVRDTRAVTYAAQTLPKIQQKQDQSCEFDGNHQRFECTRCPGYEKQLNRKADQISELKTTLMKTNRKVTKLEEQGRQLEGVLEYYRGQMDRIVKCSQGDLKQEIKNHLKESKELSIRNRFLQSRLSQYEKQIDLLMSNIQKLERQQRSDRKQKEKILQDYDTVLKKFRTAVTEDKIKDSEITSQKKRIQAMESRHKIVMEETQKKLEANVRQIKKLENQNKQLSSEIKLMATKLKNAEKLHIIDTQSFEEREQVMKMKISSLQTRLKQSIEKSDKFSQQCKLKDEEIIHCKKVIEKQLKQSNLNGKLMDSLNKHQPQPAQNSERQQKQEDKQNNEKNSQSEADGLKATIKELREKIIVLQSSKPSSSIVEEYILTIGASEAFKRIIGQKNDVIKKLIREKGQLLQRVAV